jgi:tetratricopeptide (TPR) repeat protein
MRRLHSTVLVSLVLILSTGTAATALGQSGAGSAGGRAEPVFASRDACLAKAEAAPDFALADARLWEKQGGASDARICQAFALLFQGAWLDAAKAFEAAIPALGQQPADVAANLWARTGVAWQQAGQFDRAEAAYARASSMMPRDLSYRLDRAGALAAVERYWDVLTELDFVLKQKPDQMEAWLLRAEAQRKLARPSQALEDVSRALALSPDNPDALLLRGNLLADAARFDEARADWTRASQAVDSPAGRSAAGNLQALKELEAANSPPAKAK